MKHLRPLATLAALPLLSLASPAAADAPTPVEEHVFTEADLVEGDLMNPAGEVLTVRRGLGSGTLIRLRSHFVPELLEDAEDL